MFRKLIVPALILGSALALVPANALADSDDHKYRRDYYYGDRDRHAREEWREREHREHEREERREREWRARERREEFRDRRYYNRGYYDRFGCWHAY
jgi:hypothetical protein